MNDQRYVAPTCCYCNNYERQSFLFGICNIHDCIMEATGHCDNFDPVEPPSLKAFHDKLRRRGFKDPSPEAQERNHELGELYMEDTKP